MSAFNVAEKSSEGIKLALTMPDGTPTDEYLIVLGADSTHFSRQLAKMTRERIDLIKEKEEDPVAEGKKDDILKRKLVASLITGWSFKQKCTEVNVKKFLEGAPQIQEQVNMFAGDRANFFVKPPQD